MSVTETGEGKVGGQRPSTRPTRGPLRSARSAATGVSRGAAQDTQRLPTTETAAGAATDAETLLGSLSAKHGGGRRSHCDGLPRPSICAAFLAFQADCTPMYTESFFISGTVQKHGRDSRK